MLFLQQRIFFSRQTGKKVSLKQRYSPGRSLSLNWPRVRTPQSFARCLFTIWLYVRRRHRRVVPNASLWPQLMLRDDVHDAIRVDQRILVFGQLTSVRESVSGCRRNAPQADYGCRAGWSEEDCNNIACRNTCSRSMNRRAILFWNGRLFFDHNVAAASFWPHEQSKKVWELRSIC